MKAKAKVLLKNAQHLPAKGEADESSDVESIFPDHVVLVDKQMRVQ